MFHCSGKYFATYNIPFVPIYSIKLSKELLGCNIYDNLNYYMYLFLCTECQGSRTIRSVLETFLCIIIHLLLNFITFRS